MDRQTIDAEVAGLGFLEECAANGDGDGADAHLRAEDALLFKVLCAIADGIDNPQGLAAYAIQSCAKEIRGRCFAELSASAPD